MDSAEGRTDFMEEIVMWKTLFRPWLHWLGLNYWGYF